MKQNKLSRKPFKRIFQFTDIEQNIVGKLCVNKLISAFNILNCKVQIKENYTKTNELFLKNFQRLKLQPQSFQNFDLQPATKILET